MAKSPHFERASRSHSSMSLNLISVDRSSIALSVLLCGAIVADSGQRPRLLRARRERPSGRRAAQERDERAALQLIELHPLPPNRERQDSGLGGSGQGLLRCKISTLLTAA